MKGGGSQIRGKGRGVGIQGGGDGCLSADVWINTIPRTTAAAAAAATLR